MADGWFGLAQTGRATTATCLYRAYRYLGVLHFAHLPVNSIPLNGDARAASWWRDASINRPGGALTFWRGTYPAKGVRFEWAANIRCRAAKAALAGDNLDAAIIFPPQYTAIYSGALNCADILLATRLCDTAINMACAEQQRDRR